MGDFLSNKKTGGDAAGIPADLRATFAAHGQEHVFRYVDSGVMKEGSDEISALISQLRTIDPARMNQLHVSTMGEYLRGSRVLARGWWFAAPG